MDTEALERLHAFRQVMYTTFGCRRDALVEILDALPTTPGAGPVSAWPRLESAPVAASMMRRAPGTMSLPRLEHLVATHPLEAPTAWYAVDASLWPRNDAHTSGSAGLLLSSLASFQRPAHRGFLELLQACAAP